MLGTLYILPLIACFPNVFTDIKRERYDVVEYMCCQIRGTGICMCFNCFISVDLSDALLDDTLPIILISLPAALELVAGLFNFNIATNVDMIARPNNLMVRTGEPLPYGFLKML